MNRVHRWLCRSDWWKQALHENLLPWALQGIELGDDLLEVGPGPGLTTDFLRERVPQVTSIEIDHRLASLLKSRLARTNVKVVEGDATQMPFEDRSFSGVVSFTMLHHVPSPALQDRLLSEVYRVLLPGGVFVGTDSIWSLRFQLIHIWDTMVIVEPEGLKSRLEAIGFKDVGIKIAKKHFRFRAWKP
jgi:SAM-dependent methyltransferase